MPPFLSAPSGLGSGADVLLVCICTHQQTRRTSLPDPRPPRVLAGAASSAASRVLRVKLNLVPALLHVSTCVGVFAGGAKHKEQARRSKAGNKWSLDELLNAPLPEHPAARRSISDSHKDKGRCTHPTSVQHWVQWEEDVKNRLRGADIAAWRAQHARYDKIGNVSYAYEVNEATATSAFYWNACTRLNQLFAGHDTLQDYRFTRAGLTPDSQVVALNRLPPVERQPEEIKNQDSPDICLVRTDCEAQPILHCSECKSRHRLAGVHEHPFADVWEAARQRQTVGDVHPDAAYNALAVMSQELGYMSRRGHATGIITTYEYTWLLKTDKAGTVWVSDAIHCSNGGNSKHASVTEVLLYSVLKNFVELGRSYPTACKPGQAPISHEQMESDCAQAMEEVGWTTCGGPFDIQ
ncbi:hypothetical protein ABBQ38_011094 [Trebouxia sp. C0009 RCD-2024]